MPRRSRPALKWIAISVASVATAAALVAGVGLVGFGSIYAVPALARGQVVMANPGVLRLGTIDAGRSTEAAFTLINFGPEPVTVNGMQSSCTCVGAEDLPLDIPPRGHRRFRLRVSPFPAQAGQPFSQAVGLYLRIPGPRPLLTVRGTVANQSSR